MRASGQICRNCNSDPSSLRPIGHSGFGRRQSAGISMIPSDWRNLMPDVLVRGLDDDVLEQLKAAAKANKRSLQAEIHDVLRRAGTRNLAETRRLSAQWLKRLGRARHSDSAASIRQDRNNR